VITLGTHRLANPWILAPMAGVSERPFRVLALEMGAALAPTELVSAVGLIRNSGRSRKFLARGPTERPFCVQLFGGDPAQMAEAAIRAREAGADILDINMGCPVPKVTKNGAGSALLCHPERGAEIVSAMRAASGLPVTVKIRAGWDTHSINAPEVAKILESGGAAAVALHARTRAQGYTGRSDWNLIGRVKAAVRIPVIGNGDVHTPGDAARMLQETGCDAVMVGRAALGYPWIFRELCGGDAPTPEERCATVRRHFEEHLELVGDELHGIRQFRKHLLWYARGLRGAAAFRVHAMALEARSEVLAAVDEFFEGASVSSPSAHYSEAADFDVRGALG
jgi:tRNA-dihydrouridine synthase B